MYKRFKWNPEIRWCPQAFDLLDTPALQNHPSRIFVGSTFELFHESLPENWMDYNFRTAKKYPQHTFIFLTKQPQNLIKWSPFPDNCWVGLSITGNERGGYLEPFVGIEAKIKFLSCEPLLKKIIENAYDLEHTIKIVNLSWVIIGQQTPVSQKTMPRIEWIKEIVETCDKASIPVFLKDNLKTLLPFRQHYANDYHGKCWELRQEFPELRQ